MILYKAKCNIEFDYMPIVCIFKNNICQTHTKNEFGEKVYPLYIHLHMLCCVCNLKLVESVYKSK